MSEETPTAFELLLERALEDNDPAPIALATEGPLNVAEGASWPEARTVRTGFLRALLLRRASRSANQMPLTLQGAHLEGGIDLRSLDLGGGLNLLGCYISGSVDLRNASAGSLSLVQCVLPEVNARQVVVAGDMVLQQLVGLQQLVLTEGRVGGQLMLQGTVFQQGHPQPLSADLLHVEASVQLAAVTVLGAVDVSHARFQRLIVLGSHFNNPTGFALTGDQLAIDSDITIDTGDLPRSRFDGTVVLSGAKIGGNLEFYGSTLNKPGGDALVAPGISVGRDVTLRSTTDHRMTVAGALRFERAHIAGQLALQGLALAAPGGAAVAADGLDLKGDLLVEANERALEVEGAFALHNAVIGGSVMFRGVTMSNSEGPAFAGDGIAIARNISWMASSQPSRVMGEIRLINATVGGQVRLNGLHASCPSRKAVTLEGSDVADALRVCADSTCRPTIEGIVSLIGTRVRGQVSFEGASFSCRGAPAIIADSLRAEESMFWRESAAHRLEVDGSVQMIGASIQGHFHLEGARVATDGPVALMADGLRVEGDLRFGREDSACRFEGAVHLQNAQVTVEANLMGARVSRPSGLFLMGIQTDALLLPSQAVAPDLVDLSNARVALFRDNWSSSERVYKHRVSGFEYDRLSLFDGAIKDRLHWLAHVDEAYLPQAYETLSRVYAAAGRVEDSRAVLIEKLRARRQTHISRFEKAGNWLLDQLVRFGYRPQRAVYLLVVWTAIGAVWDTLAFPRHFRHLEHFGDLPQFHGWLYSLDTILPIVQLGQKSAWTTTGALQYWNVATVVVGWVLGLILAGLVTANLIRS